MESFRNKFIIHEESGHPGRKDLAIYAEKENLMNLADEILKQKLDGKIQINEYATYKHGQSSRVQLRIESKTKEELDFYHTTPTKQKVENYLRATIEYCVLGLAIYGAWSLLT